VDFEGFGFFWWCIGWFSEKLLKMEMGESLFRITLIEFAEIFPDLEFRE
jgi:hypothetical protein